MNNQSTTTSHANKKKVRKGRITREITYIVIYHQRQLTKKNLNILRKNT
jgi:hypothetical protein